MEKKKKKKLSLRDLFFNAKKQQTPVQEFISNIEKWTGRRSVTIRKWIAGQSEPDDIVKDILAKKLDIDPEFLFPKNK